MEPWAAITIEPEGVKIWVHNWILVGTATSPQELWDLAHEGWHKPEIFWQKFYTALGHSTKGGDPKLQSLTLDDLGL